MTHNLSPIIINHFAFLLPPDSLRAETILFLFESHLFIQSVNIYLLSGYYVADMVLMLEMMVESNIHIVPALTKLIFNGKKEL